MNPESVTPGDRALLGFMSLTTLASGTAYLVAPAFMAAQSGLGMIRPEAIAEIRGYYAGLQIGMGVLFALGLRNSRWASIGLGAAAVLFLGNGIGRLLGIALARTAGFYNLSGLAFEFAFGLLAARQIRRYLRAFQETL